VSGVLLSVVIVTLPLFVTKIV